MKYKVLGTNDIQKFVQIMMRCKISQHVAMGNGIDEDIIDEVNRLAVKRNVAILTLPDGLLDGKDHKRKFIFVPRDKKTKGPFGIFVPMAVGDNIGNYGHFIETDELPAMDIFGGMVRKSNKPVKLAGRPKRKGNSDIGIKDEKRLKFLLSKDLDVDEFLKCINEEEKK